MQRRNFLAGGLAAGALAMAKSADAQSSPADERQYYELRKYQMTSGAQGRLTQSYIATALIPALNKMGIGPVGAFNLYFGAETPAIYLLLPSASLETLMTVQQKLAEDAAFVESAKAFWSAPAAAPPFVRVQSQLLRAFAGYPKVTPPKEKPKNRCFQLRTYESPTEMDHVLKVEMFQKGEFSYFQQSGMDTVFFSEAVIGPRMPSITYMVGFADTSEIDAKWALFNNNADWKKLSKDPKYSFESIVSNVDSLILKPLASSQI